MSRREKLIDRLVSRPTDFKWEEATGLMTACGFEKVKKSGSGKRGGGSHRRFYNAEHDVYVRISKPHPRNILKRYQIDDLIEALVNTGYIEDESAS